MYSPPSCWSSTGESVCPSVEIVEVGSSEVRDVAELRRCSLSNCVKCEICRAESGVACGAKSCLVSVRRYSALRDDWVVLRTVILVSFRFAGPVFLRLFCRRVILCNFVYYVLLM